MLTEEYNNKIKFGMIKMWRETCIVNSNNFSKATDFDRCSLWQSGMICKDCGLIQNTPQLSLHKNIISSDL